MALAAILRASLPGGRALARRGATAVAGVALAALMACAGPPSEPPAPPEAEAAAVDEPQAAAGALEADGADAESARSPETPPAAEGAEVAGAPEGGDDATGPETAGAEEGPFVAAEPPAPPGGAGEAEAGPGGDEVAALPPVPRQDPETLMGLDRRGITALLGAPGLVRRDAPAEVWQYAAAGCVLDLFLYGPGRPDEAGADGGSGDGPGAGEEGYRVVYYEARGRDGGEADAGDCLTDLVAAHRRGEASSPHP